MQVSRLFRSELVLHGWGVFYEPGLFRSATMIMFIYRHGQWFRQEPEGDGGREGDRAGDEVAQPPRAHPAGIARSDRHSFCVEIRTQSAQRACTGLLFLFIMVTFSLNWCRKYRLYSEYVPKLI